MFYKYDKDIFGIFKEIFQFYLTLCFHIYRLSLFSLVGFNNTFNTTGLVKPLPSTYAAETDFLEWKVPYLLQ